MRARAAITRFLRAKTPQEAALWQRRDPINAEFYAVVWIAADFDDAPRVAA